MGTKWLWHNQFTRKYIEDFLRPRSLRSFGDGRLNASTSWPTWGLQPDGDVVCKV